MREIQVEKDKEAKAHELREKVLTKSVAEKAHAAERVQRELSASVKTLSELRNENRSLRESASAEAVLRQSTPSAAPSDLPPPTPRGAGLARERDSLAARVASLEKELAAALGAARQAEQTAVAQREAVLAAARAEWEHALTTKANAENSSRESHASETEATLERAQAEIAKLREERDAASKAAAASDERAAAAEARLAQVHAASTKLISPTPPRNTSDDTAAETSTRVSDEALLGDQGSDADCDRLGSLVPLHTAVPPRQSPRARIAMSARPAGMRATSHAVVARPLPMPRRILSGRDAARWQED